MTTRTAPETAVATTQIHRIYIKATPEAVWDAITKPEWTERYGYGEIAQYDLKPGGAYVGTAGKGMQEAGVTGPVVDGEVIEADPPRKLVQTWRMLMDPGLQAEGFTRLTHEIAPGPNGGARLTIIHELAGAPGLAALVSGAAEDTGAGGGWPWVLSDLKSLLETGTPLAG
jgi:uncharacterized protein YndB with AHSA1/START domain